ncbi:MAG TPA: serine hydrolase [Gemmatales bacterium]|nr:serine hydrolase [Gemmatales bacterium]
MKRVIGKRVIGGGTIMLLCGMLTGGLKSQEPEASSQKAEKPAWQIAAEKQALPLIEKKKLNALVIGVVDRQGKKHFFTLGEKPGSLEKLDENTIFEIGSITKTMTAFLLADAIQRLEAKLDDPVQSYLPAGMVVPKRGNKEITVEDLATHTSGFPRSPVGLESKLLANSKLMANPYGDFNEEDLKKSLANTKPKESAKPNVSYSNYGMGLLGYALTQKYKKSYEALLQERLFTPLGMKSSTTHVPEAGQARFVEGFAQDGKSSPHWEFLDTIGPAGAVRSTAADMLLYLEAAMGRTKKSPPALAFDVALAPQFEMNAKMQIGLAWIIAEINKKRIWWHNGGTGGFSSFAGFSKSPAVGVIVLSNRSNISGEVDKIGMKVLEALMAE